MLPMENRYKYAAAPQSRHPRRIAMLSGKMTYIGRPCSKNHDGTRYTVSASCMTCAKAARKRK